MNVDPSQAKSIFLGAAEIAAPMERDAYLAAQCGQDEALRHEVDELLRHHEQAGAFLESPATGIGATMDQSTGDGSGVIIGPYKLLERIGEGGMGTVWLAQQQEPVKRVLALKLIKTGMDSKQIIARFEAERQALALMDHPNIAKVLDGGTTPLFSSSEGGAWGGGRPYFVMDFVKGAPITKYCDEHHLTPRQRLELFIPVCHAIQHAHQKGIIHRDLKPSNVLVALYDGKPVPKVIDFGVAKAAGQSLTDKTLVTGLGHIVGTLEYMSPEQAEINQLDIDTRSDIYSLGVLLYELLTGSPPFSRKELQNAGMLEMLRVIREEEPSKPSMKLSTAEGLPTLAANRGTEPAKLTKLVRGELDWIVMKALEKDRNRRYETANSFAMDVQRYLADEQVLACPPSLGYRLRKFVRRNKAALAMACVIAGALVLAVVGLAVSNWLVARERDQKTQALSDKEEALTKASERAVEARKQQTIARAQELLARRRFYAAQMYLAMQAWRAGELPRVLELLEGQRPASDEEDLRGFEWYYLWRQCNSGRRLHLHGHTGAVLSLAYSPDGRTIASASWDRTVRLWDAVTGKQQGSLAGHSRGVWQVAFSPDGKTLASSGQETGSLILWDVGTGKPRHTIAGSVNGLAFSRDSAFIAGGLGTQSGVDAKLWDIASGAERVTLADAGAVLGFLPDGETLVTAWRRHWQPNGEIRIWDLKTGSRKRTIPTYFDAATLSADGTRVATSSSHAGVVYWDTATGMQRGQIPTPALMRGLAYSPDGKFLAGGSEDRTVAVWDVETGRRLAQDVHLDPISSVAFSPDGKMVASSTLAGAVKVWDMTPAGEAATIPNLGGVTSLRFDPSGRTLLVGNSGPTKLIDVVAGEEAAVLPASGVMAISADANTLAGPADADRGAVWDVRAGRTIGGFPLPRPEDTHPGVALSPDGKLVATYYRFRGDNTVKLCDVAVQELRTLTIDPPRGNRLAVNCAEFSPDGKLLAAGFQFQWVTVWDVATGKVKLQFSQKPSMMWVESVAFSPDNKALAVGTDVGAVTLWEVESGKQLAVFRGHTNKVFALGFFPDGRTLASAGADKTVRLWDVITGQERAALSGHQGTVLKVQFSPDGNTLASTGGDGTVKLWRAATDPEALARRTSVASDDPHYVIATEYNRSAWYLATPDNPDERNPTSAVELAQKAVALFPQSARYWLTLGVAHYRAADWKAAVTALDKSEELAPGEYVHKEFIRAMAFWQLGDKEKARDCYERASERLGQHAPHDPWASHFQREAAALLELAAPPPPVPVLPPGAIKERVPPAQQLLDAARPHAEKRDWKRAAAELNKGFEWQHRNDPHLCYRASLARLLAGDVDGYAELAKGIPARPWGKWEALDVLRTRTIHPRGSADPAALVRLARSAYDKEANNWNAQNLGMAHYRAGEYPEALRRIEEALKLNDWYLYWPVLAMCHHQLGNAGEARKWLDQSNQFFRRVTESGPEPLKVTKEPFWEDWAYFEVMRQEANALIGAGK